MFIAVFTKAHRRVFSNTCKVLFVQSVKVLLQINLKSLTQELKIMDIWSAKAVPLQAWSGPEGSSKLRFSNFVTTAQEGGKVISLMHRPPLLPGNVPGTHLC